MGSLFVHRDASQPAVRIGELSRRVGVSDVGRAWKRRYSLFSPRRSPAAFDHAGANATLDALLAG